MDQEQLGGEVWAAAVLAEPLESLVLVAIDGLAHLWVVGKGRQGIDRNSTPKAAM